MSILSILESLISMLTALMLFLGSSSVPNVNPGEYFIDTETVQTIFDEGDFKWVNMISSFHLLVMTQTREL